MSWPKASDKLDYRDSLIERRISMVGQIILVTGGKGGVGKSLVASTAALLLSSSSTKTGLLDLDLHGPSCCEILHVRNPPTETSEGLVPPTVGSLKVMSLDLLAEGRPTPLTGTSREEVVKEVLALTEYGPLDILLVDLPPGTGDELLTVARYARQKCSALLVTTPTQLSIRFARRVIKLLRSASIPILGLIENMAVEDSGSPAETLCREENVRLLGRLAFDPTVFNAGKISIEQLLNTSFTRSIRLALREAGLPV